MLLSLLQPGTASGKLSRRKIASAVCFLVFRSYSFLVLGRDAVLRRPLVVASSLWLEQIGAFTPTSDVGAGRRRYTAKNSVFSVRGFGKKIFRRSASPTVPGD